MGSHPARGHAEESRGWVAVALSRLFSVDLLRSCAAAVVGTDAEANPLAVRLLDEPLGVLLGVHLLVTPATVGRFVGLMRLYRRTPASRRRGFDLLTECWPGLLVAAGLLVSVNDLPVPVRGRNWL